MSIALKTPKRYDALIIGGGPSGLSAALGLARTRRTVAVFDNKQYRNAPAKQMGNVPAFDGAVPSDWRRLARANINHESKYNQLVDLVDATVVSIKEEEHGKLFVAQDHHGNEYRGRKLILASGVTDLLPEIPGFKDLWGHLAFHCVYCHGYEHADQHLGILIGDDPIATFMTLQMVTHKFSRLSKHITILWNGTDPKAATSAPPPSLFGPPPAAAPAPAAPAAPAPDLMTQMNARNFVFELRKVARLEKSDGDEVVVHFEDGNHAKFGAIVCVPAVKPSVDASVLRALKIDDKVQARGHLLSAPPFGKVREGVFVAGDAATPMNSVVQAQSTGQMAGAGADEELAREDMQLLLSGGPQPSL